jgi:hypothetical protein
MKQFRFYSEGMAPASRKKYLSAACKNLPTLFTVAHIKPGMFSASVVKRLIAAQHGTKVLVKSMRYGFGNGRIWVEIIDKDSNRIRLSKIAKEVRELKKKLKRLSKTNQVIKYLTYLKKIAKIKDRRFYPIIEFK